MMASSSICRHWRTCTLPALEMLRQVEQVLDLARRQPGRAHRPWSSAPTRASARTRGRHAQQGHQRSHTDCAAFTEICWPTIERASVVKASPRLCSRALAELRDQRFITRSRRARCRQASSQ